MKDCSKVSDISENSSQIITNFHPAKSTAIGLKSNLQTEGITEMSSVNPLA